MITCFIFIKISYEPNYTKYDKYIKLLDSCSLTQKKIDSAISKFGRDNPMFLNIRSDNEFAKVEKRLINSNCLDKNYNKASSDCFYVIIEGEVYCVCHSNMKAIDKNINWINKLISNNKTDEKFDYIITVLASQICLVGLFCRK